MSWDTFTILGVANRRAFSAGISSLEPPSRTEYCDEEVLVTKWLDINNISAIWVTRSRLIPLKSLDFRIFPVYVSDRSVSFSSNADGIWFDIESSWRYVGTVALVLTTGFPVKIIQY